MDHQFFEVICMAEAANQLTDDQSDRKYWVHPVNLCHSNDYFDNVYFTRRQHPDRFFTYYRMSIKSFDELLEKIRSKITKKQTPWRSPIRPEERLTITLRYLSTGKDFVALAGDFLLGRSTVSNIVRETCEAIWDVLQPTEMPTPTIKDWLDISNKYYLKTNFPNCLGAIDGKHIRCKNPINSGSLYYNYKHFFSVVLMAVVDAECCFICIDVGSYGRESDCNVFKQSNFGKQLYSDTLSIPSPAPLPNTTTQPQPFVFIGDEAFGIHKNLLRPYPGRGLDGRKRVFNYRLSRARRCVECAFGILSNKWRVLHNPILVEPDFVTAIVKTTCVLHNFVRKRDGYNFEDTLVNDLDDIEVRGTANRSDGREVRDYFANYFIGPGAVDFQNQYL